MAYDNRFCQMGCLEDTYGRPLEASLGRMSTLQICPAYLEPKASCPCGRMNIFTPFSCLLHFSWHIALTKSFAGRNLYDRIVAKVWTDSRNGLLIWSQSLKTSLNNDIPGRADGHRHFPLVCAEAALSYHASMFAVLQKRSFYTPCHRIQLCLILKR